MQIFYQDLLEDALNNHLMHTKNFNKVCRFCLHTNGKEMFNLFDNYDACKLSDIIKFARIKIRKDEVLPNNICNVCFSAVKDALHFQSRIQESDIILRTSQIVLNLDSEYESKINDDTNLNNDDELSNDDSIKSLITLNDIFGCNGDDYCDKLPETAPQSDENKSNNIEIELNTTACNFEILKTEDCGDVGSNGDIGSNGDGGNNDDGGINGDGGSNGEGGSNGDVDSNFDVGSNGDGSSGGDLQCDENYNGIEYNAENEKYLISNDTYREVQKYEQLDDIHNINPIKLDCGGFKCPICSKIFTLRCRYEYHKTLHEKNSLPCPICNKLFRNQRYIKNHMKIHSKGKTYKCDCCKTSYSTIANLRKHIKNVHRNFNYNQLPIGKNFLCHLCAIDFTTLAELNSHIRIHSPITDDHFVCPTCGKEFDVLHKLTKHITAIHSAPRKFQCEICSKFYKQNKHLKEHMLVHSGIKNFKCSLCPKTFARKHELKFHDKVHTNLRDIECPICSMPFTQNGNMQRHLKSVHSM